MSRADQPAGPRGDILLIGLILAIAFGAMAYLSAQSKQELRQSPSGFDGLADWLNQEGIETRPFFGGWSVPADSVGLAIIPLYDADLTAPRQRPATTEELLAQRDEYDIGLRALLTKAAQVPMLVILPKWRSGMRLTGLAHPVLTIDPGDTASALHGITGADVGAVSLAAEAFTRFEHRMSGGETRTATLYLAQTMEGRGCRPILGEVGRMLLGTCPLAVGPPGSTVVVLADPDLFNNHGLRLAENAWIARDVVQTLAREGAVYIDHSPSNWIVPGRDAVERERSWEDLARFFAYPVSLIWLAVAAVMALAVMRSGVRFGPVPPEQTALEVSRAQVIRVRARLLRLTGQDGALLSAYVPARLAATARRLFGPGYARRASDEAAILRHAGRRDPALAQRLEALLDRIRALPATLAAAEAIRYVDDLDVLLDRLTDDPR
ncbi:MAG: hypothetical protein AAGC57_01800 [Pseudomonadota bacterium]